MCPVHPWEGGAWTCASESCAWEHVILQAPVAGMGKKWTFLHTNALVRSQTKPPSSLMQRLGLNHRSVRVLKDRCRAKGHFA